MDIHKDFAELGSLLNANPVEYLIVGGYAVAFHGAPRFTGDLPTSSIGTWMKFFSGRHLRNWTRPSIPNFLESAEELIATRSRILESELRPLLRCGEQ
jgi:hypothetical protein